jgi:hypothetical protein
MLQAPHPLKACLSPHEDGPALSDVRAKCQGSDIAYNNQREKKSPYMRAMTLGSTLEGDFFPQECVSPALQSLKQQMDSSVTEYLLVLLEAALLRPPL